MISIKNIYYMLAYSYSTLNESSYAYVNSEKFEYASDLFAVILSMGIAKQIRRGLGKEYIPKFEELSSPTGKIDVNESIKKLTIINKKLVCEYNEYSGNIYINQILKSTIKLLIECSEVTIKNKKSLKKVYSYFSNVDNISPYSIKWNNVIYNKNQSTYKMLINICFLIISGMLMNEEEGNKKLSKYIDARKNYMLFEKFVLNYYRKHYTEFSSNSSKIKWDVYSEDTEFLPEMRADIILEYKSKTLIIDTKFYNSVMDTSMFSSIKKFNSANLYQIFTYVKNKDKEQNGNVGGLLLYAKTNEDTVPNNSYFISGNKISVKTIDLETDFSNIKTELNNIIEDFFQYSNSP